MKFFLSFLQSNNNYPIPAYGFWPDYIKNGIVEAGHSWTEIPDGDWALGLMPKSEELQSRWKHNIWQKTVSWLKKNPADLFLSYLYPEQIDVHAINTIRQLGIPCINFFCDHVRLFKQVPAEFACFDVNWVPEFKALTMYTKAGYPYLHLPMPVWIEPQHRIIRKESFKQLTFIGSKDIQRQLLLEDIARKRSILPLKVYGEGWVEKTKYDPNKIHKNVAFSSRLINQYQFLMKNGLQAYIRKLDSRKIEHPINIVLQDKVYPSLNIVNFHTLTAESMITIGVNRYPSYHYPLLRPNTYSRLRDIEAPMLGACYLAEWTPGIELLYDLGTEIETYKDADELIYKADLLTAHPAKRYRLKTAGQKRALQSHSIPQSIKKIAAYFQLKA